jgi:hypothetical protein
MVLARRQLLTDEERRLLLGVPRDPDTLARHYTLTRSDHDLVTSRRGAANRLGFAVQLALPAIPAQPWHRWMIPSTTSSPGWRRSWDPDRRIHRICPPVPDDDGP